MADYINYSDLVARYPQADTRGGSDELTDSFINQAEAEINAHLAPAFTVPFSDCPAYVKDLTIDLSYTKLALGKWEDRKELRDQVLESLRMLREGETMLVTDSGTQITPEPSSGLYSSTSGYHPTFNVDETLNWEVDSSQIEDIENDRGL